MRTPPVAPRAPVGPSELRQVIRAHSLLSFFVLAHAGSWIISTPYIPSDWGLLPGDHTALFILKPFAGPTAAAVVMAGVMDGREGLQGLRRRLTQHGAGWGWWVAILAGAPILLLLGIAAQPGTLPGFRGLSHPILVRYPVYFALVFFGVALPEAVGWRGFALPRMQPRYGPLWGTLASPRVRDGAGDHLHVAVSTTPAAACSSRTCCTPASVPRSWSGFPSLPAQAKRR